MSVPLLNGAVPGAAPHACGDIVLIEDTAAERRLLEEAFEEISSDIALRPFEDGQDAVNALLAAKTAPPSTVPDVVIANRDAIAAEGPQVLEAITTDPDLGSLPIVILAQSDDLEEAMRWYAAGARAYLEKPTDFTGWITVAQSIEQWWVGGAQQRTTDES